MLIIGNSYNDGNYEGKSGEEDSGYGEIVTPNPTNTSSLVVQPKPTINLYLLTVVILLLLQMQ